jgi:hypothetical protein
MAPIRDINATLSDMGSVDQEERYRKADMQARYSIIEWIVAREELDIPSIMIHQRINTGNEA